MRALTESEYRELRERIDREDVWVDSIRGRNGWASYKPEDVPAELQPMTTNEEKSAVEVHEWVANPPDRYFAYVSETDRTITTWMGDLLGSITYWSAYTCPGFGWKSERVAIRVRGTNGVNYYGTYYKSAGQYARIRRIKR